MEVLGSSKAAEGVIVGLRLHADRVCRTTLLLQVKQNGLVVFVPKYGIEGPVYLTPKDAANNANATQQVRLWVEPLTMLPADVAMAY